MLLKLTLLSLFIFPSYMVLAPAGQSGSVPQLLAFALFGLWLASTVLGLHQPAQFGHPGRPLILLLTLSSCASYALLYAGLSGISTLAGRSAADRWMLLLLAMTGVCFATTESVRTIKDAMSVVRWALGGGTICSVIAILQFVTHINPLVWLTPFMIGFSNNADNGSSQIRGDFLRAWGTALHPIELGVVLSMLVPLAVWRALYDHEERKLHKYGHWLTVILLLIANAMTVSRSGLICLAITLATVVPFLTKRVRRWGVYMFALGVGVMYVLSPRLIETLVTTVTEGSADDSVLYRIDDYPLVLRLMSERPWFGTGPGTWIPAASKDILDNGYLYMGITTGLTGLVALVLYMIVPPMAALKAARQSVTPELRLLAASAAAGGFIATAATGTFDSFSFPTFALFSPFFVGLSGACWLMREDQRKSSAQIVPIIPQPAPSSSKN